MITTHPPPDPRPAVVLLHSSMSSRSQWSALLATLEADFRCIAVDLLGYGKSPFPANAAGRVDSPYTLGHEVDAVSAAIAAHLAPGEAFHLIGHSYGGATALRLARQMRDRVLSLAVFEPAAFHLLPRDDAGRAEIEAAVAAIQAAPDARAAAAIFIDYWNGPGAFASIPGALQDKFTAQIAKVRLDFEALLGEPATLADMAALDMPALVLTGKDSPLSARTVARLLAAALPNATMRQTEGGHMAPLTHAHAVNPLLARFLGDVAVAQD